MTQSSAGILQVSPNRIPVTFGCGDTSSWSQRDPTTSLSTTLTLYLLKKVWKKRPSLQEVLDLLQNLPSEISDVLRNYFSVEEVPTNNLLGFSLDS
ncbi:hypothetical protein TNCV_4689901 [Trichonephila clavipes]|nr:hypothetical protein TNCV_4689901 [Trichonephila clavipes]